MIDYRKYKPIDPNNVWGALGDGKEVYGVVFDDTSKIKRGVYDLMYEYVSVVIDILEQNNTLFFTEN